MPETLKFEVSRERLELVKEAVDTQVRLLDAYINKRADQIIRLHKFQIIQSELEGILLAD